MKLNNNTFLRLDTRCFKAFMAVVEYKSFTLAAERADMTQSVVSQHIAKLEDQLKHQLFIRTNKPNKEAVLTDTGKILFQYIIQQVDSVSNLLFDIEKCLEALEGPVQLALPPGYTSSPGFLSLLNKSRQYQKLELKIDLMLNHEVYDAVISGYYHFAVTTNMLENPYLHYRPICTEEYVAVASSTSQLELLTTQDLMIQKFVAYPGMEAYADPWLRYYLPKHPQITTRSLSRVSEISSAEGAIMMVQAGHGVSFFPRHCIAHLLNNHKLVSFDVPDKHPLVRPLYLVYLNSVDLPRRVKILLDLFDDLASDNHEQKLEVQF